MRARALGWVVALLATGAWAHKASDSYLTLVPRGAEVSARWDIALKDLDLEVELDADGDGQILWREVLARKPELVRAAQSQLQLSQAGAACVVRPATVRLTRHSDGVYAVLDFSFGCPAEVEQVRLDYALLFQTDPQHRGLVRLAGAGDSWVAFSATERSRELTFAGVSRAQQLGEAFASGVHHIAKGWDHLCFLFALLLPSVLRRRQEKWESVARLRPALLEVLKVVTSFTLAHSVTLALAAFDVVRPEPKWVEVAIAASVGLAALNNLWTLLPEGRWSLAFGLGLLHGFGFVSAMQDLGAGPAGLWISVLGFNLGVEAGQALIVALFVPLAFALRDTRLYRVGLLQAGSIGILGAAFWWLGERI
ncbi:MAG: hypothetical protein H6Q89_1501 [Myxococcaceae bacterium]|nr:hypothetical protein [Myxococcaceae bacterium]